MFLLSLSLALVATLHPGPAGPPDFTGYWKLVDRETSAWRGRSSVGAHEEDLAITQSPERLTIRYGSDEGRWDVSYPLTDDDNQEETGEIWSRSRWKGDALIVKGRRPFKTSDGEAPYDFEERFSLSPDGRRMTVVTRIKMFPKDLVRTSVYERVDGARPLPFQAF